MRQKADEKKLVGPLCTHITKNEDFVALGFARRIIVSKAFAGWKCLCRTPFKVLLQKAPVKMFFYGRYLNVFFRLRSPTSSSTAGLTPKQRWNSQMSTVRLPCHQHRTVLPHAVRRLSVRRQQISEGHHTRQLQQLLRPEIFCARRLVGAHIVVR